MKECVCRYPSFYVKLTPQYMVHEKYFAEVVHNNVFCFNGEPA